MRIQQYYSQVLNQASRATPATYKEATRDLASVARAHATALCLGA